MAQLHTSKILKFLRSFRILILLLPIITILSSVQQVVIQTANFIVVITLMVLTYVGHQFHFPIPQKQNQSFKFIILQQTRKIVVCLMSSYLIAFLICEVYYITVSVYTVSYGEEIVFWFRVIVTLSNMEANIQLCDKKHRKYQNYSKIKSENHLFEHSLASTV